MSGRPNLYRLPRFPGSDGKTPQEVAAHIDHVADNWEEYERRKAEAALLAKDGAEYEQMIQKITDELGL